MFELTLICKEIQFTYIQLPLRYKCAKNQAKTNTVSGICTMKLQGHLFVQRREWILYTGITGWEWCLYWHRESTSSLMKKAMVYGITAKCTLFSIELILVAKLGVYWKSRSTCQYYKASALSMCTSCLILLLIVSAERDSSFTKGAIMPSLLISWLILVPIFFTQ